MGVPKHRGVWLGHRHRRNVSFSPGVYMRSLIRRLGGASPLSRPSTLTDAAQWCQFPSETTYTFSLMPRLSLPSFGIRILYSIPLLACLFCSLILYCSVFVRRGLLLSSEQLGLMFGLVRNLFWYEFSEGYCFGSSKRINSNIYSNQSGTKVVATCSFKSWWNGNWSYHDIF